MKQSIILSESYTIFHVFFSTCTISHNPCIILFLHQKIPRRSLISAAGDLTYDHLHLYFSLYYLLNLTVPDLISDRFHLLDPLIHGLHPGHHFPHLGIEGIPRNDIASRYRSKLTHIRFVSLFEDSVGFINGLGCIILDLLSRPDNWRNAICQFRIQLDRSIRLVYTYLSSSCSRAGAAAKPKLNPFSRVALTISFSIHEPAGMNIASPSSHSAWA